jgi:hypothetical protein
MAEYALRTYRLHDAFPDQYVLYVGMDEMRMPSELVGANFYCGYKLVDIRTLDEELLLNSPFDGDSIMAILTKHRDRRETIRRILARIATMKIGRRDDALKKLTILAGLRKLGDAVRAEVKHMPILNDIMDHDLLGPTFREGEQKGLQQGELTMLRRLLEKRFGAVPAWMDEHLAKLSTTELEEISLRLFDTKSIDELFSH